jgi:hypothetical protein
MPILLQPRRLLLEAFKMKRTASSFTSYFILKTSIERESRNCINSTVERHQMPTWELNNQEFWNIRSK